MRRFSREEVRDMMSPDHRHNTANARQMRAQDVSADQLIDHWLEFHIVPVLLHFDVKPSEATTREEDNGLFV